MDIKEIKNIQSDNRGLRELLWLRHGCDISALYGDDGEMQCNHCVIDFKRDSVQTIMNQFEKIGKKKFKAQMGILEKIADHLRLYSWTFYEDKEAEKLWEELCLLFPNLKAK